MNDLQPWAYYHAGSHTLRDQTEMDKKIEDAYRQMPDVDIDSIDIVEEAKEWLYHANYAEPNSSFRLLKGLTQKVEEQWDCMDQLKMAQEQYAGLQEKGCALIESIKDMNGKLRYAEEENRELHNSLNDAMKLLEEFKKENFIQKQRIVQLEKTISKQENELLDIHSERAHYDAMYLNRDD